jgi:hypothetical protein
MKKQEPLTVLGGSFSSCTAFGSYRLATVVDGKGRRVFVHSPANKIGRTVIRTDAQCLQRQIELSQDLAKREHNHVSAVAKAPRKHCANAIAVFIAERS